MDGKFEEIEVLITVKTSPEPSEKYFDTVCVAAIRIDGGRREWVRLYPIQFRHLAKDERFRKYELLRLYVRPPTSDDRHESHSPDQSRIVRLEHLANWTEKASILDEVPRTTTCELQTAARINPSAPSLGMVDVRDVGTLTFSDHPGWTTEQRHKLEAVYFLPETDLFGQRTHPPPRLQPPRFIVRYSYRCDSARCKGHHAQLLDWELTALQARFHSDADIKSAVTRNFYDIPTGSDRLLSFYVGNFFAVQKRAVFSILGIYYPKRADVFKARSAKDTLI